MNGTGVINDESPLSGKCPMVEQYRLSCNPITANRTETKYQNTKDNKRSNIKVLEGDTGEVVGL